MAPSASTRSPSWPRRREPSDTAGKDFFDTGTALVTANPVSGLKTQTVSPMPKKLCWGGTS